MSLLEQQLHNFTYLYTHSVNIPPESNEEFNEKSILRFNRNLIISPFTENARNSRLKCKKRLKIRTFSWKMIVYRYI